MIYNNHLQALGLRLFEWFKQLEMERRDKEIEWAESLRQYRGEYDPQELQKIRANGGSEVYPKITRYKVLTALAKINEIIFPDIDKNWSIEPSPYPTVPQEVLVNLIRDIVKTDENGQPIRPSDDEIKLAIHRYVTKQCKNMEAVIEDDLNEMGYQNVVNQVLFSGLIFGTGVLKGVLSKSTINYTWKANGSSYDLVSETIYRPYCEFVPIWDWYPDTSVANVEDCEGIFQRHVISKHDLRELMERRDFDPEAIKRVLKQFPKGNAEYKSWEIDIFDANRVKARQNRYEVLEYWGYVDGKTLKDCGVDVPEDLHEMEIEANIWMCGAEIIKAVVNPLKKPLRPYHVFYYEKDETSIFGTGLPRIARDSQLAIAAATRMILDNAAITAGPILEVNHELLLQNGQDVTRIHPRKIFLREGKGAEAQYPAIRSLEFSSHMGELIQVIQLFKNLIDEETTIYSFFGEPGRTAHETARGVSMRMSLVNMTIKDIVRRFDAMNTSFIRAMYEWNMQFNPNPDIKGDFEIVAKGSTNLVAKEIMMDALDLFAQTIRPDEVPYIKTYEFLRERMRYHNLPYKDLLRSEEEVAALMQAQQDQEALEMQKAMMKADIDYTRSKALHMLAKSKRQQEDIEKARSMGAEKEKAQLRTDQAKALKLILEAQEKKRNLNAIYGQDPNNPEHITEP